MTCKLWTIVLYTHTHTLWTGWAVGDTTEDLGNTGSLYLRRRETTNVMSGYVGLLTYGVVELERNWPEMRAITSGPSSNGQLRGL